ncbi:hypothetical protein DFH06DRAFT_906935, partial [Mycena polygramma]
IGINWNLMEANEDAHLSFSADEEAVASLAEAILERFDDPGMSEDEFEERSDDEQPVPDEPKVSVLDEQNTDEGQPRKRARTKDSAAASSFWYPWTDRITCTLDILMHLPRSVFSHRQLDLFLWLLKVNNVDDVPSVKSMQTINLALQKLCGIDSIPYDGALGHKYYEMANPKGQRWLKELPDERTTPMARISGKDYYIHEPAMLSNGQCVIPARWFFKAGQLFAKCWEMHAVTKDNSSGWRVYQPPDYVVPASLFLKDFITLQRDAARTSWKYTNPVLGNRWRAKADGHRVVTFPVWMYCDDTSGNMSKKWNEHNSFLMTPAGLPREESQKEYNIHFLCTEAQDAGIWAWDIVEDELVLVIPEVLALLGDNPMQSEFACHIGLRGKLFCRACWVKGTDA